MNTAEVLPDVAEFVRLLVRGSMIHNAKPCLVNTERFKRLFEHILMEAPAVQVAQLMALYHETRGQE